MFYVFSTCHIQMDTCEVLIVHTDEAEEWAKYLQNVFISSRKFSKKSVFLKQVEKNTPLGQSEMDDFHKSKCILLLLSMQFLENLYIPIVLETFLKVLHPPSKMVLLFCGVTESEGLEQFFSDWQKWKRLYPEDETTTYISTVLQTISEDSGCDSVTDSEAESEVNHVLDKKAEQKDEPKQTEPNHEEFVVEKEELKSESTRSVNDKCVAILPNRIQCGTQVNVYIILKCKLKKQIKTEVEFSCKNCASKRESGVLENEYTVSAKAPDMPSGSVLVTLYSGDLTVCSMPITYYTGMGEISNFLENAINPMEFMCQAFNITSCCRESLDRLLTESLKTNMPVSGLHLFGINQLEEENMSAYQRNEELPTLLHFAAKYGLKKLTTVLLQCPGALQAYSVVNKYGDYPNNIAEKNGFRDLRQFMDEYVETADMLKTHIKESITQGEDEDIYESMSNTSRDILMRYSLNPGCDEDIYESMMELNPDCIEDIYEDMDKALRQASDVPDPFAVNTQETMLRKFLEGKSEKCPKTEVPEDTDNRVKEGEEVQSEIEEEEEDPYKLCVEDDVYDTVEQGASYIPEIVNRPPAPIPRPSVCSDPEEREAYISKVFSEKQASKPENLYVRGKVLAVRPVRDRPPTTTYDPFAGMKTPGQRQLILLQEKVKLGDITVEEAVQEFKEWQLNQKRRSESLRFQQENLKKLRDSITRRQKEKQKSGKNIDLEITAPIQQFSNNKSVMNMECAVYEPSPRVMFPPPAPAQVIHRGNWHTGSTTSTSSNESNRSSTRSSLSFSSGAEADNEDISESYPGPSPPPRIQEEVPDLPPPRVPRIQEELPDLPPPRVPRIQEELPDLPPPRIPPRPPARVPERSINDRYVACPPRPVPQLPPRQPSPPPPIPRRTR
nr:PREDICTED: phosphoinositide 3-kinase adapter protein 1 isoform X1 [Lepisosteus oculatus]